MPVPAPDRRDFLRISAGAAFFGTAGGLGALGELSRAMAADAFLEPERVRFGPEIEPIIRTIEETPRGQIVQAAAELLRSGNDYKRLMTALFLAGVRNIDSWNSGGSFHCVLAINSAHLLAMDAPASERLLPFFWALDSFKAAQRQQPRPMMTIERKVSDGSAAIKALRSAVESWDLVAAEIAAAGVARSCTPGDAFEALWVLGSRDFRPIGHKAIFVAQTWRTLQTIGWQHAEPALRSLGRSLAGYGAKTQNNGFAYDDQCHASNLELVAEHGPRLAEGWDAGDSAADAETAAELLTPIRAANARQAGTTAAALMTGDRKVRAGAIWDVVHLAAAELMLRRSGIAAVHAVTSVNALHFGFRTVQSKETRLFLLLQAVGWMAHFTKVTGLTTAERPRIDILDIAAPAGGVVDDPVEATEWILSLVGTDQYRHAACCAIGYAEKHAGQKALLAAARRRVFTKGTEAHQYKYPAAAIEDITAVSSTWRPRMLAATMLYLPAASEPDSELIQRAKDAVAGL